jgi:glycosyltransferase involved in cell wall biosynthesis
MLHGQRVIAIVPALDEAPRIAHVITSMPAFVDRIVVVDDGSTDATSAVARGVNDARVDVLAHARRSGVFAAIATGYRRALAEDRGPEGERDAFVVLAGDGQMVPADVEAVVTPIVRGEVGYVKGDRFAGDGGEEMPRARWLGGQLFSRLTTVAIGRPVHDSQCGFTAIARAACARLDLARVWQGFGYPNDLLATLCDERIAFAEVPVRSRYRDEVSRLRATNVVVIAGFVLPRAFARRAARYVRRLA